jgi:hypothetical protein
MSKRTCILTNANAYYSIPLFNVLFEYIIFSQTFEDDDYDLVLLKDNIYFDFIRKTNILNAVKIHGSHIDYGSYDSIIKYEIKNTFSVNYFYENASDVFGYQYRDPFTINDNRLQNIGCVYIDTLNKKRLKNIIIINLQDYVIKKLFHSNIDYISQFHIIDINCTHLIDGALNFKPTSFDELFFLLLNSVAVYTNDSAFSNLSVFMGVKTNIYYPSCGEKSIKYSEEKNVRYFERESDACISKSFPDLARIGVS